VRWRPRPLAADRDGRIVARQAEAPGRGLDTPRPRGRWILPGFIDTHVHSPQLDVIASYGTELLDWLTTHTFPAEARHADAGARRGDRRRSFSTRCSRTARPRRSVFPTVHAAVVDALFAAAEARGMRIVAGKVLMDRNAPKTCATTSPAPSARWRS
jgi:guanine deaminase